MISVRKIFQGIKGSIDGDVAVSSVNQSFRLISGPLLLVMIPIFLKPEIQGYWFTFGSISALSIFADLGFTTIILQFSAHEFAHLKMNPDGTLEGPSEFLGRLSSLFRFVLKWTGFLVAIAFPVIFTVGWAIFSRKGDTHIWLMPWVIYVAASALGFLNSVVSSFVTGCNQVANIQKRLFFVSITQVFVTLISLFLGTGLYAIGLGYIVGNIVSSALLLVKYSALFKIMLTKVENAFKWGRDIFRLLWKYALSWSSGYLIFQIYTPFMFIFHGPVEAGKVGISISLATAMFSISNIWIAANTPKFNMMVSKGDWKQLDRQFRKNLLLSMGTYLCGIIALGVTAYTLSGRWTIFDKLAARFVSSLALSMLVVGWFMQLIINGLAVYLRAHKQEPLVVPSIVSGLFLVVATYFSGELLPSYLYFSGFLVSYAFGMPWVFLVFVKKRQKWHQS